jgi:hypothetical protein
MVTATAAALLLLLPATSVFQTPGVRKIGPKGGGACASATDCQLTGECKDSKCSCDPGWTGPLCLMLDLAPLPVGSVVSNSYSCLPVGTSGEGARGEREGGYF